MFKGDGQDDPHGHGAPRPFDVPPLPADGSLLNLFKSYWDSARGGDPIPARTSIDPAHLDAALPFSFVAERVAPQTLRLRVAGQRLSQLLGMDARGMPLCSFFTTPSRDILGPVVEQVMTQPAMAEMRLSLSRGLIRAPIEASMVLMPLQGPHGLCDRVLGAIFSDFIANPRMARFEVQPQTIRVEPVRRSEPVVKGPRLAAVGGNLRSGLPARPTLRLVVDNG